MGLEEFGEARLGLQFWVFVDLGRVRLLGPVLVKVRDFIEV